MSLSLEQKEILREDGQYARLYIDFDEPNVVFAAQINETFNTTDLVRDFGFDNVSSGAYTDILAGMTALIGSIPGADDLGQARVRKAATSSRIYIGVASDVHFANDVYVTVIDERKLWRKLFAYSDGVLYADEDIAYSDQHANFSPVAMAGPHRRVWLSGADVAINFDGSQSYCIGSTISAYAWTFPGALSSSGAATATPSATYDAPGRYHVSLTVTAANGKTHTAWRTLRIFDASDMPAVGKFSDMVGSFADGGFSCQVTAYVDVEMVRPGALVTVFARDFYGGEEISVGLFAGAENQVIQCWIAEEGIVSNPQRGSVTFRIETANYWQARMEMQTLYLTNVSGTPADWTQIQGMTLAKALHHTLFWRTTLMDIVDVHLPLTDTRVIPTLELSGQTAYEQLAEIGRRGFVTPLSDQYNRFFCQVDPQYLDDTARDALPVIMEITKQDRRRGVRFDKHNQTECAQVALSSETTAGTLYSLSPGQMPGQQGRIAVLDKIAASSQAESNSLAGLHRGRLNNQYPDIPVTLAANNRAISIAPAQYVQISIDAADNPRGEDFSGRAIPREMEYEFEPHTGKLIVNLRLEAESFEDLSVNGTPPGFDEIVISPFPPDPPDPPDPPEPFPDPDTTNLQVRAVVLHCWGGLYVTYNINDVEPTWQSLNENIKLDDSLSPRLLHQIGAHRFDKTLVACSLFGVYVAKIGATPGQLYKAFDLGYVDSYCPRGAAAGTNVIYGCGIDAVSGAIFVWAGNNAFYRSNAVPAEYPETIMIRSLDEGASWTRLRPKTFGLSPGDIDRFWGFDHLRNITVADGLPIAQSSNTGNSETSFQQMVINGIDTDNLYRFSRDADAFEFGNYIHHRIGYSKDLIYYHIPAAGSVLRKFILGPDLESSLSWSTDEVPVADVALSGNENTRLRDVRNMLGIDPLGENCLIAGYDGYFWRSVDGGDHWDQDVLIPNDGTPPNYTADGLGRNPCLVSPSPGVWLAAANRIGFIGATNLKRGKVMLSEDDGATWDDKTGNLYDIGAADTTPSGSNSGLSAYNIEVFYGDPEGAPE
jgi:hypothetical protein